MIPAAEMFSWLGDTVRSDIEAEREGQIGRVRGRVRERVTVGDVDRERDIYIHNTRERAR